MDMRQAGRLKTFIMKYFLSQLLRTQVISSTLKNFVWIVGCVMFLPFSMVMVMVSHLEVVTIKYITIII